MDAAQLVGPVRVRWPAPAGDVFAPQALDGVVGTAVGLELRPPDPGGGVMVMAVGDPGPGRIAGMVSAVEIVEGGTAVVLTIDLP